MTSYYETYSGVSASQTVPQRQTRSAARDKSGLSQPTNHKEATHILVQGLLIEWRRLGGLDGSLRHCEEKEQNPENADESNHACSIPHSQTDWNFAEEAE